MSSHRSRVAVIGIGTLGGQMAERLMGEDFDVAVCDLDEAKLRNMEVKGARITRSASDCSANPTVLIAVLTESQVREVASSLASRADGSPLARVAVMSTISPHAMREVGGLLRAKGVRVVDAPNSGGALRALAGKLTIMAGGAAVDLEGFAPVFRKLADNIFHCGELGAGQMAKIVNNVVCHANTTLTAEVFRLGMAHGLKPQDMARVMEVSTGRNYLTADPGLAERSMAQHASDRKTFDATMGILRKDARLAANLVAEQKADYPMITGLADLIGGLNDQTFQTWQAIAGARQES